MALYRDEVARITLRQVRAQFPPRTFEAFHRVKLSHGAQSCVAVVETSPAPGCFGGIRRWFRCPRCGAKTIVLGFAYDGPGCRACIHWRSRNHVPLEGSSSDATAPHIGNVTAVNSE